MTRLSLQRRIKTLEAWFASGGAPPPMHPVARLLNVLVAFHLGGAGPTNSLAEAMARGLGYGGPKDFKSALMAHSDTHAAADLNTRWCDAMVRLFALKGAALDCERPVFGMVVEALFSEMPERLQRHPFLAQAV